MPARSWAKPRRGIIGHRISNAEFLRWRKEARSRRLILLLISCHRYYVLTYSVAASLDPTALAGRTSEEDLENVFNPFGVGAEGEREHILFVNPPNDASPVALTVHSWFDENAGHHRFASYEMGPGGVATARREVSEILIAHGGHSIPIERWDGRPIYLLVTARPPTADHPHKDPKGAVLDFQ